MITPDYVRLMAAYTQWQNRSLQAAAETLDDTERRRDRGAFFGSIHATLSHLLWGDRIWLHRLAGTAPPGATDIPGSTTAYADWQTLTAMRNHTDAEIVDWSRRVTDDDLAGHLSWRSGQHGVTVTRPRWALVVQLFNHGTHHRGQVHAMLTAAGAAPDATDVQYLDSPLYPWPR